MIAEKRKLFFSFYRAPRGEMCVTFEASCIQNSALSSNCNHCNHYEKFPGNAACTLPEHKSSPWKKQVLQRTETPGGTHSA